jgi:hypothetical protein
MIWTLFLMFAQLIVTFAIAFLSAWAIHHSSGDDGRGEARGKYPANANAVAAMPTAPAGSLKVGEPRVSNEGAAKGKQNGNYHHGTRSMETTELWRPIKSFR